ncbi:MAG: flagellin [Deltaproteobacteria bacterium]|jgi:flagellin|nr:flagellin [Deltaproteobacteria bacterium]MBT4524979.1 flagellin [Deltaproteobacteria bacterium]
MTYRVNHNVPAINTHRWMSNNHTGMVKTLEKLSSGQKINRASDGPASLVIAEHLKTQVMGTTQAIDNSEAAVSMIQTAEANLSEVNSLLGNIRQLILHSLNEGAHNDSSLTANQKEIDNAIGNIERIARSAQFGERKLLDGTNGTFGNATGENLKYISASTNTGDSREEGFDVKITSAATKTNVLGSTAVTQDILDAGETLIIIEDGKQARYTSNSDDTADTFIQNFRNAVDQKGIKVDVNLDESGKINMTHKLYGSRHGFQVVSSSSGILSEMGGELRVADKGDDVHGTINGETATGKGQYLSGIDGAKCVEGLTVRYTGGDSDLIPPCRIADKWVEGEEPPNELAEIPEGGVSVGRVFVTQNSIKFQIGGNGKQNADIAIGGVLPENIGKGVANVSGFDNLADIDVRNYQGAEDALMLVDQAMQDTLEARGSLGAFQKNSLESNLSNLRIANENLISSESVIRDTDMAKEMATYTKNMIKDNTSAAMFAQANQLPQNVLQLLQ